MIALLAVALGLAAGAALCWPLAYAHGYRDRAALVAPQPTPRPVSHRREWAADFAHARAVLAQDTYRPRHGLVMAHVVASIGRPPAELVVAR